MTFSANVEAPEAQSLSVMAYGDAQHQGWVLADELIVDTLYAEYLSEFQAVDVGNAPLNELSEAVLGTALKQLDLLREQFVLVARLSGEEVLANRGKGTHVGHFGLYRKHIFRSVKQTLRRLQHRYIDVLQFDCMDSSTPLAEVMQTLHDLIEAGHARYVEVSAAHAWQLRVMQKYARANHLTSAISFPSHGLSTPSDDLSDTDSVTLSSPSSSTSAHALSLPILEAQ